MTITGDSPAAKGVEDRPLSGRERYDKNDKRGANFKSR